MENKKKFKFFEQYSYSTIHILCRHENGQNSSGTGFFYGYNPSNNNQILIITNKHVVKNTSSGKLIFTKNDPDGSPNNTDHHIIEISDFENKWVMHPDPDIDLCAFDISDLIMDCYNDGIELTIMSIGRQTFPTEEDLEDLDALENIIMVGYPNGFSDTTNNKPIFRKGITATDVKLNYCGKSVFLIDAAVFPGSSGSPVMISRSGTFKRRGEYVTGNQTYFLGVVYAVYLHNAQGHIIELPINQIPLGVMTGMPNHLGLVIKFNNVAVFDDIFLNKK